MLALILAVVLFPPAVLAFISNNAVPGDRTYPIKRTLEAGILAVASVNPTTKAWFSVQRSNRRFQESVALITIASKSNSNHITTSLNELVSQTQSAANQVRSVDNSSSRKQLTVNLKTDIKKYDEELSRIVHQTQTTLPPPAASVQVTPSPTATSQSGSAGSTPTPSSSVGPTPTPTPTPRATLAPSPTPGPAVTCDEQCQREIEEARRRLREIEGGLSTGNSGSSGDNSAAADVAPAPTPTPGLVHTQSGSTPEPVFTPIPTPTPTPTPVPASTPSPISCTACDADVVNTGGGKVDSYDISALNSCASHESYAQTPAFGAACSKMDKNGNGKIDQEEIDCAQSHYGETCQP